MRSWSRALAYAAIAAVAGVAFFLARGSHEDSGADATSGLPSDPGYAARDAQVIETGYDGRERYRLNADVIRQHTESGVIELEKLTMDYHAEAVASSPGEASSPAKPSDVWHLVSDRGVVRADGDDVQLSGNVHVTGPTPGSGEPLSLITDTMRINTPTQFIETDDLVKLRWSGHELDARGLQADLKAGTLRLESDVNGHFSRNK